MLYLPNYQTDIARKLAEIMLLVRDALRLAYAMTRKEHPGLGRGVMWIMATVSRLDRLTQRFLAGKLRPLRSRAPRPKPDEKKERKPSSWGKIPTGDMWMVKRVSTTAIGCEPLKAYLESEEVRALIAAAPQSGRLFRPLCRMLGVEVPAHLKLPERPKRVRETPEPKPKPAPVRQAYPFPGVPRRWQTLIPGINAPRLKNEK